MTQIIYSIQKVKHLPAPMFNLLSITLLLLSFQRLSAQQFTFAPQFHVSNSYVSNSCVIADFNNDGLSDIVSGTSGYSDHRLFMYKQENDSMVIVDSMRYNHIPYWRLQSIAAGDMNDDGRNDLVISYADTVKIYFQDQVNGFFKPSLCLVIPSDSGQEVRTIACGDLNQDGRTDLALTHWLDEQVKVYYQTAPQSFSLQSYYKKIATRNNLFITDMDNDGLNDLVLSNGSPMSSGVQNSNMYSFAIYKQDPNSHALQSPVFYARDTVTANHWIENYVSGIAIGDLDNDGLKDVVSTNQQQMYIWHHVAGDPHMFPNLPESVSAILNADGLRIADFNNDGKNEIATANGLSKVHVFESNSAFDFGPFRTFPSWTPTHIDQNMFFTEDLNNDGRIDILTCYEGGFSILYNDSVADPTGIKELENRVPRIFPNPSSGEISISSPLKWNESGISVYDLKGTLVYAATGLDEKISLRLNPGMYILVVENAQGSFREKLIIQQE